MIPSGQRKRSPGCFDKEAVILKATIHHCSTLQCENMNLYMTRNGAIHPINTDMDINININTDAADDYVGASSSNNNDQDAPAGGAEDLSRFLLVITWNKAIGKDTNTVSDVNSNNKNYNYNYNYTSIYNMQWLKQWAYDVLSTAASRMKREITTESTFLYKYHHLKEQQDGDGCLEQRQRHTGLLSLDYHDIIHSDATLLVDSSTFSGAGILSLLDVSLNGTLFV